jgi:beta-glucosidase
VAESRIDESARRILRDKFRLGLFDNPYIDPDAAERTVGSPDFRAAGALAQRKSIVLLKNGASPGEPILPLRGRPKIYVEGIAPDAAGAYGQVVDVVDSADLAILRLEAPYQPRDGSFLERLFHAGDLDFTGEQKARILSLLAKVPTIVAITLDRPAVIPEIAAQSAALLADFGASDAAVLDVIFGRFAPMGKLPFELPSSMEAVRRQKSDVPYDSDDPLFRFGHGLSYGTRTNADERG